MGLFGKITSKAFYGQTDDGLRLLYEVAARTMFRTRVVSETSLLMKKLVIILVVVFAQICNLQAQAAPKLTYQVGDKQLNLSDLSRAEYVEWAKALIASSEKDKVEFGRKSKSILVGLLQLENNPEAQKVFDIDAIFNRSILLAMVAVHNKIVLDDEDMANFRSECAYYLRDKIHDATQKAVVMLISGAVMTENEKLKENAQRK